MQTLYLTGLLVVQWLASRVWRTVMTHGAGQQRERGQLHAASAVIPRFSEKVEWRSECHTEATPVVEGLEVEVELPT